MNRNSKWFRILFLVIAAIFVISTCAFVNTKVQDAKAQKEYERLQELARKQQEEEDKKAEEEMKRQEEEHLMDRPVVAMSSGEQDRKSVV